MAYPDPNLIPIAKADEEGVAFTSGGNVLSSDITPSKAPSLFRIMVASDTAAKFKANVTVDETEYTVIFNTDTDLTADCVYIFDMLVHSGDSVNFELDGSGTLTLLRVQEICYGG